MEILLRPFEPGDEAAFRELNEAWIRAFFAMEERDHQVLGDPLRPILNKGGLIFMALCDGIPAGCCALQVCGEGCYELAKMAVSQEMRGLGLGRKLLAYVIQQARNSGATRLVLETNSRLENAIHLYEDAGFTRIPPERGHASPYARADVAMEMNLT